MRDTTRVLLAHLPLLLNCGHLCLQGWGNTHNFCCSCSLLNHYYSIIIFFLLICALYSILLFVRFFVSFMYQVGGKIVGEADLVSSALSLHSQCT